ncbi:MAG: HlyD family type I secretion periplasmic adaptor subunit [Alphaproteobacteria bacterium]|nr:HlyD family type I secretion periplasmic adaptor subunit [Alphaproteobacteria bacterium]MCZ6844425.1 HlyD family type I secretion periplasmic adaptor subunit [Alphaproteobacteria bacterium]
MSMINNGGNPTGISADLLRPPRRWTNGLLLFIVVTVISLIGWAWWAELEEVTSGAGLVIPASKVKVVQNLEGGIVLAILTEDGAQVKKGQVLLRIDPTGFGARLNESLGRQAGMQVTLRRLRAEAEETEPDFDDALIEQWPDLVSRELTLFLSRRESLQASLNALNELVLQRGQEIKEVRNQIRVVGRSLSLANEELELMRPAVREGIVSRVELFRTESRVNDLDGQLSSARLSIPRIKATLAEAKQRLEERKKQFRSEALLERNLLEVELSALTETIGAEQDRVARTDVRSPVDGIVKELKVTTIGQVVQPGLDLVEIVPLDDTLLIEAQVRPADIAFLRPGQLAVVKLTAYDFTLYGTLEGQLERISVDTIEDEQGERFYKILVRTQRNFLGEESAGNVILPGMVAQVDVITGKKTVLQYITSPLLRVQGQALRER